MWAEEGKKTDGQAERATAEKKVSNLILHLEGLFRYMEMHNYEFGINYFKWLALYIHIVYSSGNMLPAWIFACVSQPSYC